jgi:hypothetical protein
MRDRDYDGGLGLAQPAKGSQELSRAEAMRPLASVDYGRVGWVAARTERRCAGRKLLVGADSPRWEATVNAHGVVVAMPLGQSWADTVDRTGGSIEGLYTNPATRRMIPRMITMFT